MQNLDARALRNLLVTTALGTSLALCGAAVAQTPVASEQAVPPAAAIPTAAIPVPAPQKREAAPLPAEAEKADKPIADQASAQPPAPSPQAPPAAHLAEAVDPLLEAIRKQLETTRGGAEAAALRAFYAEHRGAPVWVTDKGFNARAENVMAEIAKADDWGLLASQFDLPKLTARDTADLAAAEIKLAQAVLKYARFARGGRVEPLQLSANLDQKLELRNPADVLKAVAATDTPASYLNALHPQHEQFKKLRAALLKARESEKSARAPEKPEFTIIPEGPQLKSGSKHANVPLLRKRLGLAARADDLVFDAELSEALKAYQRSKNIQANGQLTPKTRQALNSEAPKSPMKAETKIAKLIANMERWRWMPEAMGAFHVWHNTPDYTVRVVKNGEVIHQARVIVGKTGTQTPVFSARMQYIVFNPEWGVPDSIKVKEILPYLKPAQNDFFSFFGGSFGGADTRVLQKHNLRVSQNGKPVDAASVNWNEVDIRRYTFIQPSGGSNVLGVVKFRFPNKHDVYMHDTPQRELFKRDVRAFSHGCVRVQDPLKLAEILLREDRGWGPEQIRQATQAAGPNEIELKERIPVHLSYFTAVAGDDGEVTFYDDLYNHDGRVTAALAGRAIPADVVADASQSKPSKGRKGKRQPVSDDLW